MSDEPRRRVPVCVWIIGGVAVAGVGILELAEVELLAVLKPTKHQEVLQGDAPAMVLASGNGAGKSAAQNWVGW